MTSPGFLNRRELLTGLIGAHAALWVGCSRSGLPPQGELLSPDYSIGHRIRDGFRPEVDPGKVRRTSIVIVGGGIAGLTAAWRLKRAGVEDFVLLELDSVPGGTSRGGRRGEFPFPWGAHYVPTPMKEQAGLISLLEEMKVVIGRDDDGEPVIAEEYLCRAPQERVFVEGRWIEGLYPALGASEEDLRQLSSFRSLMNEWNERRDEAGRRMFAIPVATGSDCDEVRALDSMSMSTWMDEQGFDSPRLRWLVDFSCRDDYGLSLEQTSAWAGIFYFASRNIRANESSKDVITWPEGNGRVVDYLASSVADHIRCSHAVFEVRADDTANRQQPAVSAWEVQSGQAVGYQADQVIFAAPQFLVSRLVRAEGDAVNRDSHSFQHGAFQYGAWVVANIHVRDRPAEKDMPMCWDNVIYGSKSLGYVTSTHQTGSDHGETVLTWYYPLTEAEGAIHRQQLLSLSWSDWAEFIIADLQHAHPDIAERILNLDVMRWGHAMIQPRPGFVWGDARLKAAIPMRNVHFANTDLSGVALLEEAFYHGVRAAEEVMTVRGHEFQSIL